MRCYTFLYARRSSDDDDHQTLSLDAQEKECRSFAVHRGLAISELIRESHSARRPGRPLFQEMLRKATALTTEGKVVIISHKTDRLLRNLSDWAALNDLIDAGVELVFVTGSYPNNAQGKMAFGVNVIFAKYYVDNLSEEVHKGIKEKLARGEWPASAPLGYLNVPDKSAPARIILDPERAPLVKRAFEYYDSGLYSIASLAEQLESDGLVGRWARKRLTVGYLQDRVLRNPFYTGLMRIRGQLYQGVHPPLISLTLFEAVQKRMREKGRPRPQRHFFRYSGIFRCRNCQAMVIGDIKKQKYIYYRCNRHRGSCSEPYIREEELEHRLRTRLREKLYLSSEVCSLLRDVAARLQEGTGASSETKYEALARQVDEMDRRMSTLLDLRLAGQVSDEAYVSKNDQLLLNKAKAQEGLKKVELSTISPAEAVERYISFCKDATEVFEYGETGDIRGLLEIVGSNYEIGGREVNFEPVEPFKMATQAQKYPQWQATEEDVRKIISCMGRQ